MHAGTVAGTAKQLAGEMLGDILETERSTMVVGTLVSEKFGGTVLLYAVVGSESQAVVKGIRDTGTV